MRGHLLFLVLLVGCISIVHGVSPAFAATCAGTVTTQVIGDTIRVFHDGALLNCAAQVQFGLAQVQDTLILYEDGACPGHICAICTCEFDLIAEIPDVAPGHYLVRLLTAWEEVIEGVCAEMWVDVEESGQDNPHIGQTLQSACGGWAIGVDPGRSSTWGHIKALYR